MPIRLPPRHEPRVLAIARGTRGLVFASADPWEVRSTGEVRLRSTAGIHALRRLIRREKPTVLVARDAELTARLRRAAGRHGPGIVLHPPRLPHASIVRDLYPELPLYAPTRSLELVTRLAIAAALYSSIPIRRYAIRRHRTPHGAS